MTDFKIVMTDALRGFVDLCRSVLGHVDLCSASRRFASLLPVACCLLVLQGGSAYAEPALPAVPKFDADVYQIRSLLESGRHAELNALFGKYQAACGEDIRWEAALETGFGYFDVGSDRLLQQVTVWADRTPGSWAPRVARAAIYAAKVLEAVPPGWQQRGFPVEQTDRMNEFRALALEDIRSALEGNPKLFYPYLLLARSGRSIGEARAGEVVSKGIEIFPNSYLLRVERMRMLEPKSGGSFERMRTFARESVPFAGKNPLILTLQGAIEADKANLEFGEGRHDASIALYDRALAFGDCYSILIVAADACLHGAKYEKGLGLADRAVAARPIVAEGYIQRARILTQLGRYQEAMDDLFVAEKLGGPESNTVPELRRQVKARWTGGEPKTPARQNWNFR